MTIEIISGSGREESVTFRIALALQNWLKECTSHNIGIIDSRDYKLPVLQNVFNSIENTPDAFKPLTERIFNANAFIWVSPEYNGSITPALKNLIDHYPKLLHKPVGIVSGSYGQLGGMRAAQQMILLATAMFGIPSPQLLIVPFVDKKFDSKGKLVDESFHKNVHNFISEFLWLAERVAKQ